jgi:hypothetical protein
VADRQACKTYCEGQQGCLAYVYTNCSGAQNCWLKDKPNDLCTPEMQAINKQRGFNIPCTPVSDPPPTGCAHWSQTVGYKAAPQVRAHAFSCPQVLMDGWFDLPSQTSTALPET